jgi:hypothetical protein
MRRPDAIKVSLNIKGAPASSLDPHQRWPVSEKLRSVFAAQHRTT